MCYWGVKAFPDRDAAEGLCWLYPGSRFIYIFRNGMDVVFSMSHFHAFRGMSFEQRCRFWAERVFRYEYLRGHERALAMRFEQFLDDPAAALSAIFAHLGLPDEPGPALFAGGHVLHPLGGQSLTTDPKTVLRVRPPVARDLVGSAEGRI